LREAFFLKLLERTHLAINTTEQYHLEIPPPQSNV